jgi:hypothetical protein
MSTYFVCSIQTGSLIEPMLGRGIIQFLETFILSFRRYLKRIRNDEFWNITFHYHMKALIEHSAAFHGICFLLSK